MHDQKGGWTWTMLSLSSLVSAANEFIFRNISDLIKSPAVFSGEPRHW